jgi:cytochrome c-type protein NapB
MKKRLLITLIGLLSLFLYSYSMAESIDKAEEKPAVTQDTKSETPDISEPAVSETEAATEVTVDKTTVSEEKSVKKPAILGDSVLLYSLRGDNDVEELSSPFPNRRVMVVDGGITVSFEDQPPMVPHNIDKDRISLQENSCLKCHSKADSKLEDAPRPPKSHFRTRDGKSSKKVSAGRYFCTQCHVPQANKRPAVKNTYKN